MGLTQNDTTKIVAELAITMSEANEAILATQLAANMLFRDAGHPQGCRPSRYLHVHMKCARQKAATLYIT